ncbi:calcium-binding protein [Saccharothrix texasensis]|uniref:Hemolysin type calcium-binding protein n=1 Tax=Saccharothrix texasensis TaxID=103734 RepID=A0A3N1HHC9_9PSEU|nr:calcium-binding protein [Saccharothrix texasensis]ROP41910.1 hemolysin type calcium-binding protein [Saccharothrix texasensis]
MSTNKRALKVGMSAVVVAAQCLLAVGTADAAGGGVAQVDGVAIRYMAAAGDANVITVTLVGGAYFIDDSVPITAGPGCGNVAGDATKVQCLAMGIQGMEIRGGDLGDTITNSTGTQSLLRGDEGNDTLHGGSGNDILRGDVGADVMHGNQGKDGVTYYGIAAGVVANLDGLANDGTTGEGDLIGNGVEDLYGGNGPDTLTGNNVGNGLVGNQGGDVLIGTGGNDYFSGGEGDDWLIGGVGNDEMHGGPHDDVLYGQEDNDELFGEDGNDWFHGGADTTIDFGGADTFTGGADVDTVSYSGYTNAVYADLDGAVGDDGVNPYGDVLYPEHDTIGADVENLTGGNGNDTLTGNGGDNVLDGGLGDDWLYGLGGTDTVTYAGRSNPVNAKLDDVKNDGEFGENDSIANTVEALIGGSGNDILWGNDLANHLDGGPGTNSLDGKAGTDTCVNGPTMVNCNP